MEQTLDGIHFALGKAFDFSFLHRFGTVFHVFDDQDSGNICFGVRNVNGERVFVKFAGAVTARGSVTPEKAVRALWSTIPVYKTLQHPALIRLREVFEAGDGLGLVFDWEDGLCMGRMYPESHEQFMRLPQSAHEQVFDDIVDFIGYAAQKGYLAVDFYDGSVMYDAVRQKTTICDIDFFRPMPCTNDMGRMWGSTKFMSPEEFQMGALLDERTNVYTLGAMAFALFGGFERTREHWTLSKARYHVAKRAISDCREDRQRSIEQFRQEWNAV